VLRRRREAPDEGGELVVGLRRRARQDLAAYQPRLGRLRIEIARPADAADRGVDVFLLGEDVEPDARRRDPPSAG
jgi:hypothetical protein